MNNDYSYYIARRIRAWWFLIYNEGEPTYDTLKEFIRKLDIIEEMEI